MDKTKRESFFPAIEKRYGEPMSYWFTQMKKVKEKKCQRVMNVVYNILGHMH